MEETIKGLLNDSSIQIAIIILVTLLIKDALSSIAGGILFAWNKNFNIGDKVVLDGKDGTIISIGWRYTIIEVETIWYYTANDRVKLLKLGKRKN